MIQFPIAFEIGVFVSEMFSFAAPFIGVFFIIVVWVVITRVLNRAA